MEVDSEKEVCPVCLDELPDEHKEVARHTRQAQCLARTVPCGHLYHDFCIKSWAERANSCPKCRATFNVVEILANGNVIEKVKVEDKKLPVEYNAEDFEVPIGESEFEYSYDYVDRDWIPRSERFTVCILCDKNCSVSTGMAVCGDCSGSFHLGCLGLMGSGCSQWNCPMCDNFQDGSSITPARTTRRQRTGTGASVANVPQRSSFIQNLRREIRNNRYSTLGLPVPRRNTRSTRSRSAGVGQPLEEDADFAAVVDATRQYTEQNKAKPEPKLAPEENESWKLWEKVKRGEVGSRSTTPVPKDDRKFKKPNRKRIKENTPARLTEQQLTPSLLEKQIIQKLFIRDNLKIYHREGHLSTSQYTVVNKNVSRLMYQLYQQDPSFQRYIRGLIEVRQRMEISDLNEFLKSQPRNEHLHMKYGSRIREEIQHEMGFS